MDEKERDSSILTALLYIPFPYKWRGRRKREKEKRVEDYYICTTNAVNDYFTLDSDIVLVTLCHPSGSTLLPIKK
jgi:hypothetical protein